MAGGCIVSYPPAIWVPRGNNIFQSAAGQSAACRKGHHILQQSVVEGTEKQERPQHGFKCFHWRMLELI